MLALNHSLLTATITIELIKKELISFCVMPTRQWAGVYLIIDSFLFNALIMQKLLNTYFFVPCSQLWQRAFTPTKFSLVATLVLFLMGLSQQAAFAQTEASSTEFYKNFVILNQNNYYYTVYKQAGNPFGTIFQDAHIVGPGLNGSFDRGAGQLLIGGEANTTIKRGDDLYTPQMYYKVYLQGTPNSEDLPFTPLTLNFQNSGSDGFSNSKKWSNTTNGSNLLAATSGPGTYVLEVYYSAFGTYNNSGGSGNFNIFDTRAPFVNYTATFDVSGSVPLTWNGSQGDDWLDTRNWTPNGRPNSETDVTIPFLTSTDAKYPTIYNNDRGPVAVRTLTLQGQSDNTVGGRTSLVGGELQIYGNFRDLNAGFIQTGGKLTFAGGTQDIDGGRFTTVQVQGGGSKRLSGQLSISNELTFAGVNSVIETPTNNTANFNVNLELGARITGETENSYVSGILVGRSQALTASTPGTFGNIGVEVRPAGTYSDLIIATRRTGTSYTGTGPKNASVTRSFSFNKNLSSAFDLTFDYRTAELNGLTPSKFVVYRSVNGAAPFENLGSTSSTSNKVTLQGATGDLAATFTVGEGVNPLPVTLVSFTATPTAQGGALLRWTTATETNNKGFGIERQLTSDGTWQSVGYLASGNNANGGTYEYTDKSLSSAAFTPQAYYRLRQEDQDGKLNYSPVAVVARQAVVASTNLLLSPVPVTGASISLAFAEAGQAGSEISITNTQGQRLYSYTTQASADAALNLPVERLAAGVYIVSVRVPGQALRHARFVKL
jgi:hypothetical protein